MALMILSADNHISVKQKRTKRSAYFIKFSLGAAALAAAFFVPSYCRPGLSPPASRLIAPLNPLAALPPGSVDLLNPHSPLLVIHGREQGVPYILIEGGFAQTRRSAMRCGVNQLVRQSNAQAGLNGTFFANASVQGTDNVLIGPSLCGNETLAVFNRADNAAALTGRPLVLLSPDRTCLLPYDPQAITSQAALAARLPGLTDAFLAGAWLVHDGVAASREQLDSFRVHDAEDPRRRAFFALMPDGSPVLGATTDVTPSADLARTLATAGMREAVLLDSGFSTSLVYGQKILVTGHTSPGIPSRPVPHALVLFGEPAKSLVLVARLSKAHAPAGLVPAAE